MSRDSLSGPEKQQLIEALVAAFDSDGLEQLVSYSLGKNLGVITNAGTLQGVAFDVVDWSIRHGELPALVEAAFRMNPKNPALLKFRAEVWGPTPPPPPPGGATGAAGPGGPGRPVASWAMSRRLLLPAAAAVVGAGIAYAFVNRPQDPTPAPDATLAAADVQPTVESPGPLVTQEPPPPTPTIVAFTEGVRFGSVPFPEFTDRLIPDAQNAAWDDLGRRDVKGVVYHRTSGSIEGTDAWLRTVPPGGADTCQSGDPGAGGGCMALVDFGVDETFGEILRWNDPYGLAYPEQGVSANRSGWANGPVQDPVGAGKAFVDQNGAPAVNRDQASIQIGGNFDDPISDECKHAVAALSAYFADQANIRWNDYPTLPGEAYGFVRWHNEFYPFRECPGSVVTAATTEIIDLTREMMREYQVL